MASRLTQITVLFSLVCIGPATSASAAEPPSFNNDVVPVLTRFGCNAGGCHGKLAGQNGFRLSLRGYAPELDHATITREALGRRINAASPEESLLVRKERDHDVRGAKGVRAMHQWLRSQLAAEDDGFRQAQQIQIPQTVDGQIHGDKNVDVFSFDIADPQSVTFEVLARRHGSGLDSLLTLFDHRGHIVAVNDDHDGTTDSRITTELAAGKYFISLQDAQDHGGPAHPYRLVVQRME